MPGWIAALSPQTLLVAFAATGGVLALLLALAAVRRMRDWELRRGSVYLAGAALVAALGVGAGLLAASLQTYSRLTGEQDAARVILRELGPQHFELLLVRLGGSSERYDMRGDQWQIDARVMKWSGLGTLIGLDTVYRFERLAGRYADNELERRAPRSVYPLSDDAGFDFWSLVRRYHRFLPLADALYGSAAYVPMADGAQYAVGVSPTGLVVRPLNESARKAIGGWK